MDDLNLQVTLDRLPTGEAIVCSTMPLLTQAHTGRLRKLWSFGRPVHVGDLGGVDLDLIVHGLVEAVDNGHSPTAVLTVTKRGVAHWVGVLRGICMARGSTPGRTLSSRTRIGLSQDDGAWCARMSLPAFHRSRLRALRR